MPTELEEMGVLLITRSPKSSYTSRLRADPTLPDSHFRFLAIKMTKKTTPAPKKTIQTGRIAATRFRVSIILYIPS